MQPMLITLNPTATANLLRNIVIDANGCWNRTVNMQGNVGYKYPAVTWRENGKRKSARANRYSYTLHNGPIPEGLVVDHTCNNKCCVNPAHLEAVTQDENMRRRSERQTHCKYGHERTPENVNTQNNCKTCARAYMKAYGDAYRAKKRLEKIQSRKHDTRNDLPRHLREVRSRG